MAIETDIMDAIVARVATVPEIITINSDKIVLATSDFQDHEIPAVQIWDLAQVVEHQRGRILVNWALSLEIIIRSLETGIASQRDLWELRRKNPTGFVGSAQSWHSGRGSYDIYWEYY